MTSDADTTATAEAVKRFPSFASLRDTHSQLLQREPESDDDAQYLADVETFVDQARATGALLYTDEDRRAAQSMLNYWVTVLYRLYPPDRKPRVATLAEYDPKLALGVDQLQCPYPGVRAFREDESKYFFGRKSKIDYMVSRLKEDRLLVVVGPPGSGKTSLIRAGLLPELKKGEQLGGDDSNTPKRHFFPPIVAGSDPLASLARMLKRAEDSDAWVHKQIKGFEQDPNHLLKLVKELVGKPAVIVVDQFEEVFTLCGDKTVRQSLLANLLSLARSEDVRHVVILVMRDDDFDDEFKRLPNSKLIEEFKKVFEPARWLLPAMTRGELRDAIIKPAEYVGLRLSEQTCKVMVDEIVGEPAGLPLLQFALVKLWEKREATEGVDKAFAEMRGCRAALADSAEEFFKSLELKHQDTARRVLMKMVRVDSELKVSTQPILRGALYKIAEGRERVDHVLKKLTDQQLVRVTESQVPEEAFIELTHDSLVRAWPRMATWVQEKKSLVKRAALVLALLLLAAVGIGVWQVWSYLGARAAERAQIFATKLAFQSRLRLEIDKRLDLAMLLGLEAYLTKDSPETRGSLFDALQFTPRPITYLHRDDYDVTRIAFTQDGGKLAAADAKGVITIWDVAERRIIGEPMASSRDSFSPLIFSPDGRTLASVGNDGIITLLDAANPQENRRLSAEYSRSSPIIAFSPDSKTLASGSNLSAITLWDIASGQQKKRLIVEGSYKGLIDSELISIAFSPDNKTLASVDDKGSLLLWDVASGDRPGRLSRGGEKVTGIRFDSDGRRLAAGSDDGTVALWDVAKRRPIKTLTKQAGQKRQAAELNPISSVLFSPDGKLLASTSNEAAVIWDVATGLQLGDIPTGDKGEQMFITFSEDGKTLIGFSNYRNLFLWDVASRRQIGRNLYTPLDFTSGYWSDTAFARHGKVLATGTMNGVVLWDIAGRRPLTGLAGDVNTIAFSPDSSILAAGGKKTFDRGAIILWSAADHEKIWEHEQDSAVLSLAFNPYRNSEIKILACGLYNGTIVLWDVTNRQQLGVLGEGKLGPVAAIAFSPDGKRLASVSNSSGLGGYDAAAIVWDVDGRKRIDTLPVENEGAPLSIAFSGDNKTLALGDSKGAITLWDVASLEKVGGLIGHAGGIKSLAFSPEGKLLASGGEDRRFIVWDVASRKKRGESPETLIGPVDGLGFSPDGGTLAAVINSSAPEGKATTAEIKPSSILIWDVKNGKQIGAPLAGHDSEISCIAFRPDGEMLASGSGDGTVILWDVNLKSAQERFCAIANRNLSQAEWDQYMEGKEYCLTCPDLPPGNGAPERAKACER